MNVEVDDTVYQMNKFGLTQLLYHIDEFLLGVTIAFIGAVAYMGVNTGFAGKGIF